MKIRKDYYPDDLALMPFDLMALMMKIGRKMETFGNASIASIT